MLNFEIASEITDKRIYDKSIELTIIGIINSFFNTLENVILIVCDNSDSRQRARKITFNKWYNNNHREKNMIKKDYEIPYYTSAISRSDNPVFQEIIEVIEAEIEAHANIVKD